MTGLVDINAGAQLFDWVEYSVFCTMLFLSLLIGVYYGWIKKQDTVAEYMLGGKKMNIFPVTMSLIFSHVSGITLLGIPAEIYSYGTQYFSIIISFVIIFFIITYLYLPVFFNLQLNSLFEYLELRFSKETRTITSFIFTVSLFLFIPVVVYMPALAFNEVTGVSVHVIAIIVSLVCVFYTSIGGLRAVLWTDALQSVFTFGAILFICIIGFVRIGSITEVLRINEEGLRLEFFNMNTSPFERNTFWTMTVGSIFYWLHIIAVNPGSVQRFISVPTLGQARIVLLSSCVGYFVVKGMAAVLGLLLYVKYRDCDPIATKMVHKTGQLMPLYVMGMSKEYPGLLGLFISGVVSAALSTMSASMNTVAGTIYEDFAYLFGGQKWSDHRQNITMKIICLVLGIIFTAMVLIVEKLGSVFQMAQSLSGVTSGALIGVFTLGMFFPRANTKGAISGSIASLVVMAVISLGAQFYIAEGMLKFPIKKTSVAGCPANFIENLGFNASARVGTYEGVGSPVVADPSVPLIFQLSFLYFTMAGTLIALVVGLIVSYLTEDPPLDCLDPRLFSPCVRRFLPTKQDYQSHLDEYKIVNTTDLPKCEIKDTLPDDSNNITSAA